jgi:hypothetical protein
MTPEEENQIIDKLMIRIADKYVLIPKNRLWHFLGGAVTFAIAAFALPFAGVLAGMRSDAAVQAADRIKTIQTDVENHYEALKVASYLRYDQPVILVRAESTEALAGWPGSGGVGVRPLDNTKSAFRWIVTRPH